MGDSSDHLERTGGAFDLGHLKAKYRRREAAAKPRHTLAAIEREILEEVACQAGRYGERLDVLLAQMEKLRQIVHEAMAQLPQSHDTVVVCPAVHEVNARVADYNELRRQAQQLRHYLIIHREAMGFWNHDDVFRFYPIPPLLTPLASRHTPAPPGPP